MVHIIGAVIKFGNQVKKNAAYRYQYIIMLPTLHMCPYKEGGRGKEKKFVVFNLC